MEEKVWDVVVVGSGPAGLTAAIYTVRGALSTLVLGGEKWGGQLMDTTQVDNFPGFAEGIIGPDLMWAMRKQVERLGAAFLEKNLTGVDFSQSPYLLKTADAVFKTKTVIVATGAQTQWLGVPGEHELIGRGVSTCAPCDAPFFKEKIVAVVGGGDTAMEEATVLTKYASKVYLIHRRNEFRASAAMQEKVKNHPKIEIIWNTEVIKVNGSLKVESLTIKNNQTNETKELKVDGLFVAIGHKPASDLFKGKLEMDEKGYLTNKDFHLKTNVPGVFIAGDVFDKEFRQAIVAAGLGCVAAFHALDFLNK